MQRSLLLAFAAFYLLNCLAPLRLEYDSIHYFSLKECLENACPAGFRAAGDPHPLGYPFLLGLLSRLGLLHSFVIAAVNAVFLAGSLFFVTESFPSSLRSVWFFPLVLLQWTFIKFFAYPLSEMQYLFFSAGCIFCFQKYTGGKGAGWLLGAVVGAGLAFFTRGAGAVLAPALLAGLVWHHRQLLKTRRVAMILLAVAGVLCLMAVLFFSTALRLDLYLNSFKDRNSAPVLLREHFKEWGQLLLNIPGNKVIALLPGWGNAVLVMAGVLLACLFLYALFIRRKKVPPVILVYLIAYCLLIFNWPFYDARFWIPVFPFMAVLVLSLKHRMVLRVLLAAYVVMGLGAAGYSTYTAFNKKALARTQAGGIYRNEYETYFYGKPLSDTAIRTDSSVLNIIKRYN